MKGATQFTYLRLASFAIAGRICCPFTDPSVPVLALKYNKLRSSSAGPFRDHDRNPPNPPVHSLFPHLIAEFFRFRKIFPNFASRNSEKNNERI